LEEIIPGALYLVSTPIGNLGDITYRAVFILNNVTLIAAEDTRTTSILLSKYNLKKRMIPYYSYNQKFQTPKIIEMLKDGNSIALVSDAGTPGILDPAYDLVTACVEQQIKIIPIPGPSAFLTAVIASGLPANRFVFEGFLPIKKGRKTKIQKLSNEERTIILYESPYRLLKTAQELLTQMGDRSCVMARELTKKFEEFFRGNLSDLIHYLKSKTPKGEIVLIIAGCQTGNKND
jgi:16S rRNA (cytidine1402-2'-O)-methyltransferase